jgi:hypothetical protein
MSGMQWVWAGISAGLALFLIWYDWDDMKQGMSSDGGGFIVGCLWLVATVVVVIYILIRNAL